MTGPTREEVEEWAKRAKLPKHMRDTDSAIDALVRFSAFAAGARSSTAGAKLVREIEEAAKRARSSGIGGYSDDLDALQTTLAPFWPRLRTALLSGARSGEDARDAARYRAVRKWLVSDDPPRYLLESYPVTEDAVDVVIDAAMGGNDA